MMLKHLHFGQYELNIFSVFLVLPLTGGDMDTWVMKIRYVIIKSMQTV